MTDPHIIPFANHILTSIQKDLMLLKDHHVLDESTLQRILALLPSQANPSTTTLPTPAASTFNSVANSTSTLPQPNNLRPPLPTRKSTHSSPSLAPVPAPRTPSFPKLPGRRTSDWSPPAQQQQTTNRDVLTTPQHQPAPPPSYNATVKSNKQMAEAIYDYAGEDSNTDLSFRKGDMIEVIEHVNDDWWRGTLDGKTGIFPQNHVQSLPAQKQQSSPAIRPAKAPVTMNTQVYPTPPPPAANQYYQQPNTTTQQPYSYPPPPTMIYHQAPGGSSSMTSYAPPPPSMAVGPAVTEERSNGEGSKVQNMAKKFGSKVGEAAVFGFGATLGSEAAHAIF
ncbi:SH3 domain-containing protein [Chlamydoabsidia padenii]|nr:SH3 domain-containing protein [Chlamydoabsidia padenii]